MTRALAIACLSTALLLPATAEAAKMRFGGKRSASPSTEASGAGGTRRTLVVIPGVGGASAATAGERPARVPFPPATTAAAETVPAPALMAITANDGAKVWCRSEVVVGGFCVLN